MTKFPAILMIGAVLLLGGCFIAPKQTGPKVSKSALAREQQFQRELVFEAKTSQQTRLFRVGHEVLKGAVDLCDKSVWSSGFMYIAQQSLKPEYYGMANKIWGLADYPKVLSVHQGSGAQRAGLQELDTIIDINNQRLRNGEAVFSTLKNMDSKDSGMRMTILRNGRTRELTIRRDRVCDYPVQLSDAASVNAYADGRRIVIHAGMMDFATRDAELALVIAHELAHNTQGHVVAQQTNAMGGALIGAVLDALMGTGSTLSRAGTDFALLQYSVDFEREADYIGMYMLARTRYGIENAGKFWRRIAVHSKGAGIDFSTTHPTSAERMLAITQAEQEILQKIRNKQPLVPN